MMLPGANPAEVDNALQLRERSRGDAEPVMAALASVKDWLTIDQSSVYRIDVTVRGDTQPAFGRAEAIVLVDQTPRTGANTAADAAPPLHILSWTYEPSTSAPDNRGRR